MRSANKLIAAIDESHHDDPDDHDALIYLSRRNAKEVLDYVVQLQIRCSEFATALFEEKPDHPLVRDVSPAGTNTTQPQSIQPENTPPNGT